MRLRGGHQNIYATDSQPWLCPLLQPLTLESHTLLEQPHPRQTSEVGGVRLSSGQLLWMHAHPTPSIGTEGCLGLLRAPHVLLDSNKA